MPVHFNGQKELYYNVNGRRGNVDSDFSSSSALAANPENINVNNTRPALGTVVPAQPRETLNPITAGREVNIAAAAPLKFDVDKSNNNADIGNGSNN
ncbi:hypothetical protein O3M35_000075 [Rhynocoris fuscipes]|uniref:Uncharacterized protein n=1 Tax=Rhynocoris fuscipes TaxID=488301 RepID=A0AAW1DK78_9HEMI